MDGILLLLDKDKASQPRATGEYQNGWFIHACKPDLTSLANFFIRVCFLWLPDPVPELRAQ